MSTEDSSVSRWSLVGDVLRQGDDQEIQLADVEMIELGHRARYGGYMSLVFHTSSGEVISVGTGSGYTPRATIKFCDAVLIRFGEVNPSGVVNIEGSSGARIIRWGSVALGVLGAVAVAVFFILRSDTPGGALGWLAFAAVPVIVAMVLVLERRPDLVRADAHADYLKRKSG